MMFSRHFTPNVIKRETNLHRAVKCGKSKSNPVASRKRCTLLLVALPQRVTWLTGNIDTRQLCASAGGVLFARCKICILDRTFNPPDSTTLLVSEIE